MIACIEPNKISPINLVPNFAFQNFSGIFDSTLKGCWHGLRNYNSGSFSWPFPATIVWMCMNYMIEIDSFRNCHNLDRTSQKSQPSGRLIICTAGLQIVTSSTCKNRCCLSFFLFNESHQLIACWRVEKMDCFSSACGFSPRRKTIKDFSSDKSHSWVHVSVIKGLCFTLSKWI